MILIIALVAIVGILVFWSSRRREPSWAKPYLAELESIQSELLNDVSTFMVPDELFETLRQVFCHDPKRLDVVPGAKLSPKQVAWSHVAESAGYRLSRGDLHLYPGMLSMEGQALYFTFLRAVGELEASGYYGIVEEQGGSRSAKGEREWIEKIKHQKR